MQPGAEAAVDAFARRLADLHLDLAHARDAAQILAAAVRAVLPSRPAVVELHDLRLDEHGDPRATRPLARWAAPRDADPPGRIDAPLAIDTPRDDDAPAADIGRDDDAPAADIGRDDEAPAAAWRPLAAAPLADEWLADPDAPVVVVDLGDDPRCDPALRERLAPARALAVLPLRSFHPTAWQGLLVLRWDRPRAPDPDERQLLRVLMATLAPALGQRRALTAHADALAELDALRRLSARIGEAADVHELLAALVADARVPDARGKALAIETGPSGQPETLEIIAVHGGGPAAEATLGARFAVADSPASPLWMATPNTPLILDDLRSDPRLDPVGRAIHLRSGLLAAVVLALRWQGRWLGLIQVGWTVPRRFTAAERRLYGRIGPMIAAVLDNRQLIERGARALAEHRRQTRTLAAMLERLPLGVLIIDRASGRQQLNRAGLALLRGGDPEDPPLQLLHPDSERPVAPHERLWARALAEGVVVTGDRDLIAPDGVRRRLTVTAVPVRGADGGIATAVTVFHDITARRAREDSRARLQAELIATQRAALAERATPRIPISRDVVVVPIIGAIDRERGHQLIDAVLHLDDRGAARVVLIDLTGVPDLDDAGARVLAGAAALLRLRGVLPVLTGLRPAVAWTLAQHGPRGLTTCATLRAGLAYAARLLRP